MLLTGVSRWYADRQRVTRTVRHPAAVTLPRRRVGGAIGVLLVLIFSKYFYIA
ncbi:MAG: hypothetical protein ACRYHA_05960 [Janthinobacterium lividum]